MSDYRTGDDPLTKEQEQTMSIENDSKEIVDEILNPVEQETAKQTNQQDQGPPQAEEQKTERQQPSPLEDIETAVLLVVNSHGNVLPVVQIDNLNMRRVASPREVYRICLDAADQLSSVSILGEMTQIYSTIAKEQGKLIAQNMANLLIQAQQVKAKGPNNEQ